MKNSQEDPYRSRTGAIPSDHNADRYESAGGDLVSGCLPTFDTIII